MSRIIIEDGESIESAIRRFRKKRERDGINRELKKRAYYESPSVQKRKKQEARKRKLRRQMKRMNSTRNK